MASINAISNQVNTIAKFEADLHDLLTAMDKADVTVMPEGQAVNVYKSGSITTGTYSEGNIIPNAAAVPVLDKTVTLTYSPLRTVVVYGKIQSMGFDVAVGMTADKLVKQAAATVRTALCTAIKSGTTAATKGATVQAAAANAVASLLDVCADEAGTPIFFMSPNTFAAYAGTAAITTQTAFGMQYLAGFLGMGNAIVLPGLEDSKVYCTCTENINLCAADVASMCASATATADGVLAVSIEDTPDYNGWSVRVFNGIQAFLSVLDHCCIAEIGA